MDELLISHSAVMWEPAETPGCWGHRVRRKSPIILFNWLNMQIFDHHSTSLRRWCLPQGLCPYSPLPGMRPCPLGFYPVTFSPFCSLLKCPSPVSLSGFDESLPHPFVWVSLGGWGQFTYPCFCFKMWMLRVARFLGFMCL